MVVPINQAFREVRDRAIEEVTEMHSMATLLAWSFMGGSPH